jgi:uncharacterized protein (TIGR03382 family)
MHTIPDCDGLTDDDDPDVTGAPDWALDADGDGYGVATDLMVACVQPSGYAAVAEEGWDCDDTRPDVHPGAEETDCTDPTDYNCDGSVGWSDDDADGFAACQDCDDADAAVFPGATETCDGLDDDCDGVVDGPGATDAGTWYADADGDGYTDPALAAVDCEPPAGFAAASDLPDCDDADGTSNPGAEDIPDDGIDQDCDGTDATEPIDTGDTGDTGQPIDTADTSDSGADDTGPVDTGEGGKRDCGCASQAGSVGALWFVGLAAVALVGRRRRAVVRER